MELIEQYVFDGKGYNPVLISGGWQTAFLNYAESESLESIEKLDVHHHTDEVFILLDGQCTLIAAEISDGNITYDLKDMRQGVFYNIPSGTWHKVAMKPGCRLCIVENANTHLGDFEFHELTESQIRELRILVNNL